MTSDGNAPRVLKAAAQWGSGPDATVWGSTVRLPAPSAAFVNAYLVREDDGFTLVDTTLGGGADDLIAAAQAAGGQIRRIALTHGHGDHAGSVQGLKDKLGPDVQVLLGELDARILAGENVVDGKLPGSWPKVEWAPDVRVNTLVVCMVRTEQSQLHYGDEEGIAAVSRTVPLGRLAEPSDVGAAAVFLASDTAAYISGASLLVHGGGERPAFLDAATVNKET